MHYSAAFELGCSLSVGESDRLPVLNAGDGMHEHPSQALLDLRTMLMRLPGVDAGRGNSKIDGKTLAGVTVVITEIFCIAGWRGRMRCCCRSWGRRWCYVVQGAVAGGCAGPG